MPTVLRTAERRLLLYALAVRILPAALIYGADDVEGWRLWGHLLLRFGNPYATTFPVAWPPLWLPFTALAAQFSDDFGIPFHFIVKLPAIGADVVITFLLYSLGRRGYAAALAYALSPVSIYTTAVHGQFDSLPLLCALVATLVYSPDPERDPRGLRAGVWLGVGAAFKSWPLLVLPALLAPRQSMGRRAVIAAATVTVWVLALLVPWPFVGWSAVTMAAGYRGMGGWWGLTSLPALGLAFLTEPAVRWTFYAAMASAALGVWWKRPPVAMGALFLLLTFYVTSPGVAPQYFVWIVPFALLIDERRALAYTVIAALVLTVELTFRPYTGFIGETIRFQPHAGYARALGGPLDHTATIIDRLTLWVFFCWWWVSTLRECAAKRMAERVGFEPTVRG